MRLKKITNKLTWADPLRVVIASVAMLALLYLTNSYKISIGILIIIEIVDFISVEHHDRLRLGVGWLEDIVGVTITTILYLIHVFSSFVR